MHFSLATIIAIVPLLASATPLSQSPHATIPIFKRTDRRRHDGSVDFEALKRSVSASIAYVISFIDRLIYDLTPSPPHSKNLRSFDTYQQNTDERHPSQPDNYKRSMGEVTLNHQTTQVDFLDMGADSWFGAYIEVTQIDSC